MRLTDEERALLSQLAPTDDPKHLRNLIEAMIGGGENELELAIAFIVEVADTIDGVLWKQAAIAPSGATREAFSKLDLLCTRAKAVPNLLDLLRRSKMLAAESERAK